MAAEDIAIDERGAAPVFTATTSPFQARYVLVLVVFYAIVVLSIWGTKNEGATGTAPIAVGVVLFACAHLVRLYLGRHEVLYRVVATAEYLTAGPPGHEVKLSFSDCSRVRFNVNMDSDAIELVLRKGRQRFQIDQGNMEPTAYRELIAFLRTHCPLPRDEY